MGEKKILQYKGCYAMYCYDEVFDIWYGKTTVNGKTLTFSGADRIEMEKAFYEVVNSYFKNTTVIRPE